MNGIALESAITAVSASTPAPAKINLTLEVLGRRPDGYHDLRSLVIGVDLCDLMRVRPASTDGMQVTCNDSALAHQDNLAARAAVRLAEHAGRSPDIALEIVKEIPVGAGMGGGSSDAAATLRLCNAVWDLDLPESRLAEIGAEIGSDVPLFFCLPSAVISGRGEQTEPMTLRWSGWVLLVFPDEAVSTASVYGAWCPEHNARGSDDSLERIAKASTAAEISSCLFNDLTTAIFRVCPAVAMAHATLGENGLGTFHVTGSGSAMYRLFDDRGEAYRVATDIENLDAGLRAVVVSAPVPAGPITYEE